jgi:hypothetical protein
LVTAISCKKSSDITPGPEPPNPPPQPPPAPQEQLVGQMFFHDTGPQSQFDIYMADLFIVPKENASVSGTRTVNLFRGAPDRGTMVRAGVHKFQQVEINGRLRERVVLNTVNAVDISKYDFEVRSVENLTSSTSDDFAVNVNANTVITFVTAPDGLAADRTNTEIVYMDVNDRVRHQLTPINGKYSGNNWDPDWKSDNIIVWSHNGEIVEVDIAAQDVSAPIIPDVGTPQYDPKYSPDGTMMLFNTRQNRKKNSYIKYLETGQLSTVLPTDYFAVYADDNPTWLFSNTRITGHIFIDDRGRIYTRGLDNDDFLIITDGQRDFRYVTPITLDGDVYLIFSDWTDENNIALWIANENGTYLRELDQTGDEAVFHYLGLPAPGSKEDMGRIARLYLDLFQ